MKWLLTLQSWVGGMWERDTGVLCRYPPPNQKGQKKERSLCAGAPERGQRGQQLKRALRAARINVNQLGPSREQQKTQGGEGSTWLSYSGGDPLLLCPPRVIFRSS